MPARSEGAGRARAGGRREGGREAPEARARAGRCWAAAAVTMAESAGASSFFPLVVLLLAGSGGSGPRGIQGESGAAGRRGMQTARRGLALAVGLGRAPSPAAQYGRAGGAEGRGGGGSAWGTGAFFQAEPDRGALRVAPPAPSAPSPGFLEMWRSLAPALQHVRARGVIIPCPQMLLGAPFLPPRLWGSAMGVLVSPMCSDA